MRKLRVVIAGAGTAGHHAAASLRKEGFGGQIVLIGEEPLLPYHRPPLSKHFLLGTAAPDTLGLRTPGFYTEQGITTHIGSPIARIDRTGSRVLLGESGQAVEYDHLILALGASPRPINIPGRELEGVLELRTSSDAERLRARLGAGCRVVVVGGGFIGLEVAAASRKLGAEVTVLEASPSLMSRVLSVAAADHLAVLHRRKGVRVVFSTRVTALEGQAGRVAAVTTSDGQRFEADIVILGIGVVPNVAAAAAAGLTVDNGIVVDEYLTTEDPSISAIGDCANFPVQPDRRTRLESIQNAVDQARYVARRIHGDCEPYGAVPYFWSDQYETKLQIVGQVTRSDQAVVRGKESKFSIFRFSGTELVGVESINDPLTHMAMRRILASGGTLTPAQADDSAIDLQALARPVQHAER